MQLPIAPGARTITVLGMRLALNIRAKLRTGPVIGPKAWLIGRKKLLIAIIVCHNH